MTVIQNDGFTDSAADDFISSSVIATGAVHWVDSQTGSDANSGAECFPVATLQQAITNATANNGDLIIIKSGHAQVLSTTVALSKAGVRVFGIGAATLAPQFTVAAAIDGITVTANDCELNNLYFPVGTAVNNTARINVDARNVRVKGCTFKCGARDIDTITVTANGIDAKIDSVSLEVMAAGPQTGVKIESAAAAGLSIENSAFSGGEIGWSLGGVYSGFAHLNYRYEAINLTECANIVHSAAAKGVLSDITADDGSQVTA